MTLLAHLITEFDEEYRIMHLSASKPIEVKTKQELKMLCQEVGMRLQNYADGKRCFMVVDLGAIIIEPDLAESYSQKVQAMTDNFLYPSGLIRYGYQMTRVTAKIGYQTGKLKNLLLFPTKFEAYDYIKKLKKSPDYSFK